MAETHIRGLSFALCFSCALATCDLSANLCTSAMLIGGAKGDDDIAVTDLAGFKAGGMLRLFLKATPKVFEDYTIVSVGVTVKVTPLLVKEYPMGTQVVVSGPTPAPPIPAATPSPSVAPVLPVGAPVFVTGTTTVTPWDSSASSSGSNSLQSFESSSSSLNSGSSDSNLSNSLSSGSTASGSWGSYMQIWQWVLLILCCLCCCCGGVGYSLKGSNKKKKKKVAKRPAEAAPAPELEAAPEPLPEEFAVTEPLVNSYRMPMPTQPLVMPSYSMAQQPQYNEGIAYAPTMPMMTSFARNTYAPAPATASYMMR